MGASGILPKTGRGKSILLPIGINELFGINMLSVHNNFEVYVWTRRSTGIPHFGNHLPFLDALTDLNKVFLIMSITSDVVITVINFNHFSIIDVITSKCYYPTCDGNDLPAVLTGEINPFMKLFFTLKRADPPAIRR